MAVAWTDNIIHICKRMFVTLAKWKMFCAREKKKRFETKYKYNGSCKMMFNQGSASFSNKSQSTWTAGSDIAQFFFFFFYINGNLQISISRHASKLNDKYFLPKMSFVFASPKRIQTNPIIHYHMILYLYMDSVNNSIGSEERENRISYEINEIDRVGNLNSTITKHHART